jgi:hypothetical protein
MINHFGDGTDGKAIWPGERVYPCSAGVHETKI